MRTAWRWAKATVSAILEAARDSATRITAFFMDAVRRAFERPKLIPLCILMAVGISWLSPYFSAGLVAVVIGDPGSHQLWHSTLNLAAIGAAVALVTWVPWAAAGLATLPIADISGRWITKVQEKVAEMEIAS